MSLNVKQKKIQTHFLRKSFATMEQLKKCQSVIGVTSTALVLDPENICFWTTLANRHHSGSKKKHFSDVGAHITPILLCY